MSGATSLNIWVRRLTVIDLILELCKYPADTKVCTRHYRYDPDCMEYWELDPPFEEDGKVIIE